MSSFDSTDLECPHCGETFYYELTRCPNCGRNIYPEDDQQETNSETWGVTPASLGAATSSNSTPHPLVGILTGAFVSSLIGVLLFIVFDNLLSRPLADSPLRFIPLASVPLGSFIGGYIATALNRSHPVLTGLAVGLISIGASTLIIAYEYDLATEPLIHPETIPWWIATLLVALPGSFLRHRTNEKTTIQALFKPRTEYQLYTELLTKVQFDRPTAESLIAHEQKRAPNGTRFTWIQNAIDRWERDNRTK